MYLLLMSTETYLLVLRIITFYTLMCEKSYDMFRPWIKEDAGICGVVVEIFSKYRKWGGGRISLEFSLFDEGKMVYINRQQII